MSNLYIYPTYVHTFVGGDEFVEITFHPLKAGFEGLYNQIVNIKIGPTDEPNDVFEDDWHGAVHHGDILGATIISDFNTAQGTSYTFGGVQPANTDVFFTFDFAQTGLTSLEGLIVSNTTSQNSEIGALEAALAGVASEVNGYIDALETAVADLQTRVTALENP